LVIKEIISIALTTSGNHALIIRLSRARYGILVFVVITLWYHNGYYDSGLVFTQFF